MEYFLCLVLLFSALLFVDGTMVPRTTSNQHKKSLTEPAPSSGSHKVLVLAVEYPSQKGQYTGSQWKSDFFNLWGQFYQAQSYNTLQYEVDVVTVNSAGQPVINDPTSTSYIPVPNEISVYANGEYGWAFGSKWSLHSVVRDASTYLDSKNFDWSPYIENGKVLNVLVMSAGTDYRYAESVVADAASNYLLSTSYSGVEYTTKAGATLNSYTFCSEHTQDVGSTPLVMAHIGQCAHEFGHALGVPDMYDISSQTTGVGYFDLLGYGVYAADNEDGATPVGFGAFPKTALGWAKPTVITSEQQIDLAASSLARENFLKIYPNESDTSFYYLVENRQPVDTWDKNFVKQYISGVLIWRVNETAVDQYTTANHINTYSSKSLGITNTPPTASAVLMEADGRQGMSTPAPTLDFGHSGDVWQLGGQFNGPNDLSIAVTGLQKGIYTIYVSYLGPITIPDSILRDSAGSLLLASPLLALTLSALLCLL